MGFGPIRESSWLSPEFNQFYSQAISDYRTQEAVADMVGFLRHQTRASDTSLDIPFDPDKALLTLKSLDMMKRIVDRGGVYINARLMTAVGLTLNFFASQLSQEHTLALGNNVETGSLSLFRGGGEIPFENWLTKNVAATDRLAYSTRIGNPYGTVRFILGLLNS